MPLRILCDENIPRAIIASLEEHSFIVEKVLPTSSDERVAGQAKRRKEIILTFDSDFSNILSYPPQEYYGIIVIRIHPPLTQTIIQALTHLFQKWPSGKDYQGKLIILEGGRVRVWSKESK